MNQKILILLVVLLAVVSFLAGIFFTKFRSLERELKSQNAKPTPQAAGQPSPAVLGQETLAKISESGWSEGSQEAKVTMVEFADFQCPYCARYSQETFPQIDKEYIKTGKVRYIFHHFPLTFHQYAQKAAEASECAGEQGKFWEMHDKIFANQEKITETDLRRYAADLGLKGSEFNTCLDTGKFKDKVQADLALGENVGVSGTPAFFINEKPVSGAQPFENFQQIIGEELGK